MTDATEVLTKVIDLLKPLNPDDRQRTVSAAFTFLGDDGWRGGDNRSSAETSHRSANGGGQQGSREIWMKQQGVTEEHLDLVFLFHSDGKFDVHGVPGKTKKEKTLNAYVLTGLGVYLSSGTRDFSDELARELCQRVGCLDKSNHATTLTDKGADFSGDKTKGWMITNVGLKSGAMIVKAAAASAGGSA